MYDMFILLLIFGSMLAGFSMGLVRQLINILGLFFGLLFASYYHNAVVSWARERLGSADSLGREALLFFLVFGLVWAFVNVGAYFSLKHPPRFLPGALDRLAGMALGIFTGALLVVMVTLLLSYATEVEWPDNNEMRLFIQGSIEQSGLSRFFLNLVPTVAGMIEPFMPRGLPNFFSIKF